MDRTGVPDHFAGMWFRPHGWPFDWGTLRWCQGMATPANGCYDAENVALDEFGHIEIIGHHVNYADERDFLDSVVQYAARSRPKEGWNEHVFGRCDIARLQLEYELRISAALVSTCLSLATSLSLVPSSTWLVKGESVPREGLRAVVPVSTRSAEEIGAPGYRVSLWLVPLPIGVRNVRRRFAAVHKTTDELKRDGMAIILVEQLIEDVVTGIADHVVVIEQGHVQAR